MLASEKSARSRSELKLTGETKARRKAEKSLKDSE